MGTTATPGVGALTLTGLAPTVSGFQYDHPLSYRLVIPGVGSSFAVGDPDPLPDTDFSITSKRRVHHPWIAQRGDGSAAGPDIAMGGQRLELPLGRTVDGEVQVRVIDVAAPIAAVACDVNASLIDEGDAGLDQNYLTSGGWAIDKDYTGTVGPHTWWASTISEPQFSGFALFSWFPYDGGPWVRSSWIYKTFDGTESGGPAFTPGQKVGFRFRVNWTLQTGGGNIFAEANGVRLSGLSPSFDFWNIPSDPLNNQVDAVIYCEADGAGEVLVKLGGETYYPSCNVYCNFSDLQAVSCDDAIVGTDAERYVTGWLADASARQQLLGRAAYLEESPDGGTTWPTVIYAGFVKQITLDASLTYLVTLGDAGRGRRVSKAWAGVDPTTDFAA